VKQGHRSVAIVYAEGGRTEGSGVPGEQSGIVRGVHDVE
jgi:hypothetical protein